MTTWTDACAVLGVSSDASIDEIRIAYRHRMRALHPDRGGADDVATHDEIAAVAEAWRRLSSDPCGPSSPRFVETPPAGRHESGASPSEDAPFEVALADAGPAPRMLRTLFAVAVVLLLAWTAIFIVIAFSQSG